MMRDTLALALLPAAALAIALLCAAPGADAQEKTFPVNPPKDPSTLGLGIQRTMTLLATSTPTHRNRVRILFYGQSITEQEWSKLVADDIRRRFPNADLDIQNRAIGGFSSQALIRPAEHDVYPFYPDLVIFHVYGGNGEYEQIIKNIRSRTTAEVLMQKDHVTAWPQEKPDEQANKGLWWDYMMNNVFLPEIAKKNGCGLDDVRSGWLDYLKANNLQPKDLLKDDVHLNAHGCYLMAALVNRYLVYRPELPKTGWQNMVRTVEAGRGAKWQNGRLMLAFEGNRVDVISARQAGQAAPAAKVLIDGKAPGEFPGCYAITRPTPGPWSPLFIRRVDHNAPLKLEDWTYRITSHSADGKSWSFAVAGSVTGADGEGTSDKPFVSKSGRVVLSPDDNFRGFSKDLPPVGYECKWKVAPLFADTLELPVAEDAAREYSVTLAQGLENGRHTLEIVPADGKPLPVRAVRVYQPPVK